ncbi:MAG: stage III sporulation protein AD [Clostridia bacterium]|nr:stage III sporulation protein AD [Clostridia bacterium]
MLKVILLGFIGAGASIVLKKISPEIAMTIGMGTGLIILFFVVKYTVEIFAGINAIIEVIEIDKSYIGLIIKIIGITYIGEFAVSSLKDAGESGIAAKIEMFAKVLIVLMAIPIFTEFINTALRLLV